MAETNQSPVVVPKKHPNGVDILKFLVELLADQEGVDITYTIETEQGAQTFSTNGEVRK